MEKPVEMLMQYDMGLYKIKFEENQAKVATFLYNYIKDKLNDRIAAITVRENILYAWSYYFVNLASDESQVEKANALMQSMLVHFDYLLNNDFEIEGDDSATKPLYLDKNFCDVWFRTAVCGMIMYEYGEESVQRADKFLEENYYYKTDKYKTLRFRDIPVVEK